MTQTHLSIVFRPASGTEKETTGYLEESQKATRALGLDERIRSGEVQGIGCFVSGGYREVCIDYNRTEEEAKRILVEAFGAEAVQTDDTKYDMHTDHAIEKIGGKTIGFEVKIP